MSSDLLGNLYWSVASIGYIADAIDGWNIRHERLRAVLVLLNDGSLPGCLDTSDHLPTDVTCHL